MTMENCFSKKIQSLLKKRFLVTCSDALKKIYFSRPENSVECWILWGPYWNTSRKNKPVTTWSDNNTQSSLSFLVAWVKTPWYSPFSTFFQYLLTWDTVALIGFVNCWPGENQNLLVLGGTSFLIQDFQSKILFSPARAPSKEDIFQQRVFNIICPQNRWNENVFSQPYRTVRKK
jgi:hypothetical protein